jgi:hypothetical protein
VPSIPFTANQLVENGLRAYQQRLEKAFDADCVAFAGPIIFGIDDAIRDAIEAIENRQKKLVFMLETQGGFAETARRISDTLRFHYQTVDFLVPSHAMSAGTILVMSGDAIYMDYYSILGPIDPQVESPGGGGMIPALGYLIRYEDLLKKANAGNASTAEMEILLNFDQGRLYSYEQARDLARSLLEEWLVKYKFKNWTETETRRLPVTEPMKKERAKEIADKLNDVGLWNSHGIGINMERLRRDLNLKIDDFGQEPKFNEAVRAYHRLLTDYMVKMGQSSAIHTRQGYTPLMVV